MGATGAEEGGLSADGGSADGTALAEARIVVQGQVCVVFVFLFVLLVVLVVSLMLLLSWQLSAAVFVRERHGFASARPSPRPIEERGV